MKKAILVAAIGLISAAGVTGCASRAEEAPSTGAPSAPETVRVQYGPDTDNYGMLHLPGGSGPFPVVVMVHGGG